MRKHRAWLMGLGIGIILGASMLQVILTARDQARLVEPLSRDRLEQEAKQAGLLLLTEEQVNERVQAAVQEQEKPADEKSADNAAEQPSPSPSASPEASVAPSEEAQASEEEPVARTLYVKSNMTLSEVADKLAELGVIDDADDFVDKALSISKEMRVGTSVFTGKPSYQQIMNELTRSKP